MSCKWNCENLSALQDGELGPLAAWRVKRHVQRCPACAAEQNALARVGAALKAADPCVPSGISTRVPATPRRATAAPLVWGIGLSAAAAIALVMARPHSGHGAIHVAAKATPPSRTSVAKLDSSQGPHIAPAIVTSHQAPAGVSPRRLPQPANWRRSVPVPASAVDDLVYLNADSARAFARWTHRAPDALARLQDRLDRETRGGDRFVAVPFPRIAALGNAGLSAAAAEYQKERAVVDPRLIRKVSLSAKGKSLSDLCAKIKEDTGIDVSAHRSVADDKVTVFCKDRPLRDLMRQITEVFGFQWRRSGEPGSYAYELFQDLRSQLLEEELRNKDRNEALLALDADMERYRKYQGLTPEEAKAKAATASGEDKDMLDKLATFEWGPSQLYGQLSPDQMNSLRNGDTLHFGDAPGGGNSAPLPGGLGDGILHSLGDLRVSNGSDGHLGIGRAADVPGGRSPADAGAKPMAELNLNHDELGQYSLTGASGITATSADGSNKAAWMSADQLAQGESPSVKSPNNAVSHAALATERALAATVTIAPEPSCSLAPPPYGAGGGLPRNGPPQAGPRATSADVMEAIHKVTGADIVADYYTALYVPSSVTVTQKTLFETLNRICDAMRVRWNRDQGWLTFRSTGFFNDRLKEVPNRLLDRWASIRKERKSLPVETIAEMAGCTDAQLDARAVSEGIRAQYDLKEWELARNPSLRNHWRFIAGLAPTALAAVRTPKGVKLGQLSPADQQRFFTTVAAGSSRRRGAARLDQIVSGTMKLEFDEAGVAGDVPPAAPPATSPDTPGGPRENPYMKAAVVKFVYEFSEPNNGSTTWTVFPNGESRNTTGDHTKELTNQSRSDRP